jgi:hypothetical protein
MTIVLQGFKNDNTSFFCNFGDSESQLSIFEEPLPGMSIHYKKRLYSKYHEPYIILV